MCISRVSVGLRSGMLMDGWMDGWMDSAYERHSALGDLVFIDSVYCIMARYQFIDARNSWQVQVPSIAWGSERDNILKKVLGGFTKCKNSKPSIPNSELDFSSLKWLKFKADRLMSRK